MLWSLALGLVLQGCSPQPAPPPVSTSDTAVTQDSTGPRFGDFDPHPWTGRPPWRYPVHGLDVARYQNAINWRQAQQAGIQFAYVSHPGR